LADGTCLVLIPVVAGAVDVAQHTAEWLRARRPPSDSQQSLFTKDIANLPLTFSGASGPLVTDNIRAANDVYYRPLFNILLILNYALFVPVLGLASGQHSNSCSGIASGLGDGVATLPAASGWRWPPHHCLPYIQRTQSRSHGYRK